MRKKILVAEQSDAIRSIAESILQQNGYDVLTASTIEKAKELIITASPNMLIIGADLKDSSNNYLYDSLEESDQTASIPLLIIADPDGRSISYPDEVILPRPFEPKDFLERVHLFVGGGTPPTEMVIKETEAFAEESVDDELLDAALGMDKIEVEDSEVLGQTATGINIQKIEKDKTKKKDIYDLNQPDEDDDLKDKKNDTVVSLMIRDDEGQGKSGQKNVKPEVSDSSKLDVSNDQYGMEDAESEKKVEKPVTEEEKNKHDYDWFIGEMKKDGGDNKKLSELKENDSGKLHKTSNSDSLNQVTPPVPEIKKGGVEEFITEFKKEMEEINTASSKIQIDNINPDLKLPVTESPAQPDVDPAEIRQFCNNLVNIMAEKLAKKIADKIDKEQLYNIIKEDIIQIISERAPGPPV